MKQRKAGFTLVELMVACAVIAIGMVFILGALSRCLASLTTAQRMMAANDLLSAKIWELDILARQNNGTSAEPSGGVFESPNERFNWSSEVGPILADFGNQTAVFNETFGEQTVRVSWLQGKTPHDVSITRYVRKRNQT